MDNEYSGARYRFVKKERKQVHAVGRGPAEGKVQEREEKPAEVITFGSRNAVL